MVLFLEDEKVHERRPWEQKRPNLFSTLPPRTSIKTRVYLHVFWKGKLFPSNSKYV